MSYPPDFSSTEDEEDDCNADDEDDDGCFEEDGGDNEDMFYTSLPSSYAFHNLTGFGADCPNPSPPPVPLVEPFIDEESGHALQSSEAAALEVMVIVGGNNETGNMESECAGKSHTMEESKGENECCEEDKAQTKMPNQR